MKKEVGPDDAPDRVRLLLGAAVWGIGFASPLALPWVATSALPVPWKAALSGLLVFGIPEIFMIIAVAIVGRPGFEYLRSRILRAIAPPELVSPRRYRLGLALFAIPLLFAWVSPYISPFLATIDAYRLWFGLGGDLLLLVSLFVLGGGFWDKLAALFSYRARVVRAESDHLPG